MTHVLKLICVTFILIMTSTSVFSQDPIEIKYDSSTHDLNLSDGGTTSVNWVDRRNVWWFTNDPYISKFKIVSKMSNLWNIFDYRSQPPGQIWFEHVKNFAHLGAWNYSIIWYHGSVQQPVHDPKIAVRPVGKTFLFALISGLAIMFIPTLVFFNQKRKAKRNLKEMTKKYENALKSKT